MSFKINFLKLYGSLPHREGFEHQVLAQTVVLPSCVLVAAVPAVVPQLALLHPHALAGTPPPGDSSSPHSQQAPGDEGSGRKSHSFSGPREHPSARLGCSWPETEAPFSLGVWILDSAFLGRSCIIAI